MCHILADALPAPAQEAVAQVKVVAGQVASQVSHLVASNPNAAKAAAVPLLGVPLLLTVAGRFGAYKGPLPPSEAYSILQVTECGIGMLSSYHRMTAASLVGSGHVSRCLIHFWPAADMQFHVPERRCATGGRPHQCRALGAGAARPAAKRAQQGRRRAARLHQHSARQQVSSAAAASSVLPCAAGAGSLCW